MARVEGGVMADMKWVRDIEDEMLVKECDCPWCMHVRQLAAAVRLAEDKVDVIRLAVAHGHGARAGKELRELLAHLRSGDVGEGQPSVAGEPEILTEGAKPATDEELAAIGFEAGFPKAKWAETLEGIKRAWVWGVRAIRAKLEGRHR